MYMVQSEGTVGEQLFSMVKQWGHCDLILDKELSNPFRDELADLATQKLTHYVNPKEAALPLDKSLMLARLSLEQLAFIDKSVELAQVQSLDPTLPVRAVGAWLFSDGVTPERMAKHLERAMIVRVRNAPDALLRVWDSRVISHVLRVLTPEQVAALMGPVCCWVWIDRTGQLQRFTRPDNQMARNTLLSLQLSTEQDEAIDRIEHINSLVAALAKLGHSVPPERDPELDAVLVTAQSKGHVDVTDMLAYALHAVLIHPNFDQLPEVAEAIAQARHQGLGLCVALESFDDVFWKSAKNSNAFLGR